MTFAERRAGSCGTCNRESAPGTCPECWPYPPPVEQTDPSARRVAWVLWTFVLVVVLGLIGWRCWKARN
jgi:nitric oxide reductase large subunit